MTGPAVPRVAWATLHVTAHLPSQDRGQRCFLKSCTCSWQSQAYCQVTFENKVRMPQELRNSGAVASGRWPGLQTALGRRLPHRSLGGRASSVSASAPPFATTFTHPPPSPAPCIPSRPGSSAYSSMCQSSRYLEPAFVLLSVFSLPDQTLPRPPS